MNKLNKKAQNDLVKNLGILLTFGITIVVVIITLAIGGDITNTFVLDGTNLSIANSTLNHTQHTIVANISLDGQLGLGNLSGQVGLIGTVVALSVVLLILVTLLFRNFRGGV